MEGMPVRPILLLLALASNACGGLNQLEGSLGAIVDLTYSGTKAAQTADQLALQFVRTKGTGEDLVLQVTASLAGIQLTPNATLDLAELISPDVQRGAVSRNVLNDPRTSFPRLQRGRLRFRSALTRGQKVNGDFNITFIDGTDPACGRTVFGDFTAVVQ